MTRVLHLIADLGPTAAAKQLALLAPALPRERFTQAVVALGPAEPFGDAVRTAGVDLWTLPVRHGFDPQAAVRIRRAVAGFAPHVLHVWGGGAARAANVLPRTCRLVVSDADGPAAGVQGWLIRRTLGRAVAVVARTGAGGGAGDRRHVIPPAVGAATDARRDDTLRRELDLPPAARVVFAAGRFDAASGLKNAVWAFDIVKHTAPDLFLVLAGTGPGRPAVERFARSLGRDDRRVRFAGLRPSLTPLLGLADMVWVTHDRGGVNTALEAMAAGRPVVAVRNPDLAAVLEHDRTARLVAPGDPVRLAAETGDLLARTDARCRLGDAARAAAAERFAVGPMAERFAAVYDDIARPLRGNPKLETRNPQQAPNPKPE